MMKPGIPVLVVDFVADAVKFYTEKLGFDIVRLATLTNNHPMISFALLRKNKCFIIFRSPHSDEMIEFSQVKHCIGRGTGIFVEMKKGFETYYNKCKKKGVEIAEELVTQEWGFRTFCVKDPFGFRLCFGEPVVGYTGMPRDKFLGITLNVSKNDEELIEVMAKHLKTFGLSRRPAKKFARLRLKKMRS